MELSHQLTARFGRGFSRPNLVNMRKFYLLYPNCQTVSDNLKAAANEHISSGFNCRCVLSTDAINFITL